MVGFSEVTRHRHLLAVLGEHVLGGGQAGLDEPKALVGALVREMVHRDLQSLEHSRHLLQVHRGDVLEIVGAAELEELHHEVDHVAGDVEPGHRGFDVQGEPALRHAQGLVVPLPRLHAPAEIHPSVGSAGREDLVRHVDDVGAEADGVSDHHVQRHHGLLRRRRQALQDAHVDGEPFDLHRGHLNKERGVDSPLLDSHVMARPVL
mmetsp:Transcript_35552/g.59918  ORF Transcript_35552/g.59918 Transcript_35552/m.59918 type:complete len:206 (+) Transcript_35552:1740-2357(+)